MKYANIPLITIIALIAMYLTTVTLLSVQAKQTASQATHGFVMTICDQSHNNPTGANEQACGDAQAQTHTEYLCNQTAQACWVEDK